jgi:ABC-type sugar transport system permease subunit
VNDTGKNQKDEFRTTVTTTVVWVAGATLVIIFIALFAGIMLDKVFQSKPIFTIILTLASIPGTIITTIRIVNYATNKINKE